MYNIENNNSKQGADTMEHEIYAAGEGYFLCPMTDADRADYEELQQQTYGDDSDKLEL